MFSSFLLPRTEENLTGISENLQGPDQPSSAYSQWLKRNPVKFSSAHRTSREEKGHSSKLDLSGVQSLSDESVKALARHYGEIVLTGLTMLSDTSAALLRANEKIKLSAKLQGRQVAIYSVAGSPAQFRGSRKDRILAGFHRLPLITIRGLAIVLK